MLLFNLLGKICFNMLLSCVDFCFSALLSYRNDMIDLFVETILHHFIIRLSNFSLVNSTYWSLNGPLLCWIELSLRFLGFLCLLSPNHLLFPVFVVLSHLFLLFSLSAINIQLKCFDLLFEFFTLLEGLISHSFEVRVLRL